jgi:hypothetical protein
VLRKAAAPATSRWSLTRYSPGKARALVRALTATVSAVQAENLT